MFSRRRHRGTIIEEGLKIAGSVSAEGLVEINGHIEGDVHCTSLIISHKAAITGGVEADRILVDGRVEVPRTRRGRHLPSASLDRTRRPFRGTVGMLAANQCPKSAREAYYASAQGNGAESNA